MNHAFHLDTYSSVSDDDETQDPNAFIQTPSPVRLSQTSSRVSRPRQPAFSRPEGLFRETRTITSGASSSSQDAAKLAGISEQVKKLQSDVTGIKRSIQSFAETQQELLSLVKKLRKNVEADKFDMGKCCHTDNIIQMLGKFYTTKSRFSVDSAEKERALKLEFTNSPTGLTLQELGLRFKKFENAKLSYWRSEERRRLLGIAGYDMLVNAPTEQVTGKILQLIGQKHSNGCHRVQLENEIIITRTFIRETGLEQVRKLKDFWSSYYHWKTSKWPTGLSQEDRSNLHRDDLASYQED